MVLKFPPKLTKPDFKNRYIRVCKDTAPKFSLRLAYTDLLLGNKTEQTTAGY
jgi:hypothetical protein